MVFDGMKEPFNGKYNDIIYDSSLDIILLKNEQVGLQRVHIKWFFEKREVYYGKVPYGK